jgi:NAD(P)-dependent dehydrogenase (short-subunit alcohol dehydrogenase family)
MILSGKTVIVTGTGRGLGWGIARALGRAGARVYISDINDEEMARSEADLKRDHSEVLSLHLDVSDLDAFQQVVHQVVDRWGRNA